MGDATSETEYVSECPGGSCDAQFVGMTVEEWRETHARDRDECENAPFIVLYSFDGFVWRGTCETCGKEFERPSDKQEVRETMEAHAEQLGHEVTVKKVKT